MLLNKFYPVECVSPACLIKSEDDKNIYLRLQNLEAPSCAFDLQLKDMVTEQRKCLKF